MNFIFFLILTNFFVIFLIIKKKETFSDDFFDKLCLDDYYSCHNYNKCCSKDNYLKLGHSKHCNNVKNSNSCTSFKKKKKFIQNMKANYNEYRPGYSYIPFYNWNRRESPLCYTDSSIIPNNIIESKMVFSAEKINNNKVMKNKDEILEDDIKSKLSTYKKFINNI